ncbi:MAG: NAD-dependent epimerase/dehydratase family protein [Candidatus Aminicenantales bacterium]
MRHIVTGAAGFIGSHLVHRLLDTGTSVIGIDSFTDFYPRWMKEVNLRPLLPRKNFTFIPKDILEVKLEDLLEPEDCVFHLAAQPGVRTSWGENFSIYTRQNIDATQRLLEASRSVPIRKFVYASSSSVYGMCSELPMREESPLRPFSPYGVTKMAAEKLCLLYFQNFGIPCVSLRYFTVFGPGQRPDMAFHRFFRAVAEKKEIQVFGDGTQTRDFTYIGDIVEATVRAAENGRDGETYNVGGGFRRRLSEVFPVIEEVCRQPVEIVYEETQKGDLRDTYADISKAQKDFGYSPDTPLGEGLREEWAWIQKLYAK